MALTWSSLVLEYSKKGNNYNKIPFIDNPVFQRGPLDPRMIDCNFFGDDYYRPNKNVPSAQTYKDFYIGGRYLSIEEFLEKGINLNIVTWMMLSLSLSYNNRKYLKPTVLDLKKNS
jgi:hypothetical protein